MDAVENIVLMALLMALGVSITVSVLIGFLYYLEAQND
jgi:ABC-type nickel/cobalt efflux system permease component RcnA